MKQNIIERLRIVVGITAFVVMAADSDASLLYWVAVKLVALSALLACVSISPRTK